MAVAEFHQPLRREPDARQKRVPDFLGYKYLRGANVYHATGVLRLDVTLGPLAGKTTAIGGPRFAEGFLARFRSLKSLVPDCGMSDEFVHQLGTREGVPIEQAILEAILAVETARLAAMHFLDRIAFAAIEAPSGNQSVSFIWETQTPAHSREAACVAWDGVMDLLPQKLRGAVAEPFKEGLRVVRDRAVSRRLSPTSSVLKLAAKRRGLPFESISGQHLRLGHGVRQHHIYSSITGLTSTSATKLAADKRQTNRRLAELGLPVPKQVRARNPDHARSVISEIGYPAVVKPMKGSRGGGITVGVRSAEDLDKAFARAEAAGSGVVIEQFIPGPDHRLLVIGGRFVAALTRVPPAVTGDGKRTIRALVQALNEDPYRDGFRLFQVAIDDEMERILAVQAFTLDQVLPKGKSVVLRGVSNVSTGGLPVDITEKIHPDNRAMAEAAARAMGLDVAGIDFLTTDISRSFNDTGGGIVEVNARPGLCMHTWPRRGKSRDVAGKVLDLVFAEGETGSVPKLLVAGDRGTGAVARALEGLLRGATRKVGLSLRREAYLDTRPLNVAAKDFKRATKLLLRDPTLETLVSAVSVRRAAQNGLQLETCEAVALLPRVRDEDLAQFHRGIEALKRANNGVFITTTGNAIARAALGEIPADRILFVALRPDDAEAQAHIAAGNAAIIQSWRKEALHFTLYDNGSPVASVPIGHFSNGEKRLRTRVAERWMYAIALAYAGGLDGPGLEKAARDLPGLIEPPAANKH